MVTKWLHLDERGGGDEWIIPIWQAMRRAQAANDVQPASQEIRELGLHIYTRLNILHRICSRLDSEVRDLFDFAKGTHRSTHVFTKDREGAALRVNDDLKYHLLADVDALLYEIDSCAELMRKLFQKLHAHAGDQIPQAELTDKLRSVLRRNGDSGDWFKLLNQMRNFVAHQGTPYVAIDISHDENWDLLFMKQNLRGFEEPEKYFTLSQLKMVAGGFRKSKKLLQEHLVGLFGGASRT